MVFVFTLVDMSIKLKIDRDVNSVMMHFGPNLEIITWIGDQLLCG